MHLTALTILTDESIIKFTVWLLGIMALCIVSLSAYFGRNILKEIKGARIDRADFTNALNHKFRAINLFVKSHEKMAAVHEEKLKFLDEVTSEQKKKIEELALKHKENKDSIEEIKKWL